MGGNTSSDEAECGVLPLIVLPQLKTYVEYEHPTGKIIARHEEPLLRTGDHYGHCRRVGRTFVALYKWRDEKYLRIGSRLFHITPDTRIERVEGFLFNRLLIRRGSQVLCEWSYRRSIMLATSIWSLRFDPTAMDWDIDELLDIGIYLSRHAHEKLRGFDMSPDIPADMQNCPVCEKPLPPGVDPWCSHCMVAWRRVPPRETKD